MANRGEWEVEEEERKKEERKMHHYAHDLSSLIDLNFNYSYSDPDDDHRLPLDDAVLPHRHDGTSPLPLGMDWSPPPPKWGGPNTLWPHNPRTSWTFSATIPSWLLVPQSTASDPVVVCSL